PLWGGDADEDEALRCPIHSSTSLVFPASTRRGLSEPTDSDHPSGRCGRRTGCRCSQAHGYVKSLFGSACHSGQPPWSQWFHRRRCCCAFEAGWLHGVSCRLERLVRKPRVVRKTPIRSRSRLRTRYFGHRGQSHPPCQSPPAGQDTCRIHRVLQSPAGTSDLWISVHGLVTAPDLETIGATYRRGNGARAVQESTTSDGRSHRRPD